jgi:hypothetical protein
VGKWVVNSPRVASCYARIATPIVEKLQLVVPASPLLAWTALLFPSLGASERGDGGVSALMDGAADLYGKRKRPPLVRLRE